MAVQEIISRMFRRALGQPRGSLSEGRKLNRRRGMVFRAVDQLERRVLFSGWGDTGATASDVLSTGLFSVRLIDTDPTFYSQDNPMDRFEPSGLSIDLGGGGVGFAIDPGRRLRGNDRPKNWPLLPNFGGSPLKPSFNAFGLPTLQITSISSDGNSFPLTFTVDDGGTRITYEYDSNQGGWFEPIGGLSTVLPDWGGSGSSDDKFVKFDRDGTQTFFLMSNGAYRGSIDPWGNHTTVTLYDTPGAVTNDQISTIDRRSGGATGTINERISFSYSGSSVATLRLAEAEYYRLPTGSSTLTPYISTSFQYYVSGESHGLSGDVKTIRYLEGDGSSNVELESQYIRYYTTGEEAGFIKSSFVGAGLTRLKADPGFTTLDGTPDSTADQYSTFKLSYAEDGTIATVVSASIGTSGHGTGDGRGTVSYSFASVANSTKSLNLPSSRVVATYDDGSSVTRYLNPLRKLLLSHKTNGLSNAERQDWVTGYEYDQKGRLVRVASPSAAYWSTSGSGQWFSYSVDKYFVRATEGLIEGVSYAGTNHWNPAHQVVISSFVQKGKNGSVVKLADYAYESRHAGGYTYKTAQLLTSVSTYPVDGGTARVTNISNSYDAGEYGPYQVVVTAPTVSTGNNGTGASTTYTTLLNSYGQTEWTKDELGRINRYTYDPSTRALIEAISDFSGSGRPSGWIDPIGAANLKTTIEVDLFGRAVKVIEPKYQGLSNNNTFATYIVYRDAAHEVRVYDGWNLGTSAATGIAPVAVYRSDYARNYVEVATFSGVTPTTNGSGRPTGLESLSASGSVVQSLSRILLNDAGQATEARRYFDLTTVTYSTSLTLGTVGTNFYSTTFAYDIRGRQDSVMLPTGTMYVSEFDTLGRPTLDKVGTSVANLTTVAAYQFDGGGTGNSNLSAAISYPSGTTGTTARLSARVQTFAYDWRDRLVWAKDGALLDTATNAATFALNPAGEINSGSTWAGQQAIQRSLSYVTYSNLDEILSVEIYNGDSISFTGTSTPAGLGISARLRAKMTSAYDELGRNFRSTVFSVNPSTGSVSSDGLVSNSWFDARGQLSKSSDPNGSAYRYAYDGVGRLTDLYAVLPSDVTGTNTLSASTVLEQYSYSYDANSNITLSTVRQRFHDATGTGTLTATGSVGNRAYFTQNFYDHLDRITDSLSVGTNGGTNYAAGTLSYVPSRSDTNLVSSFSYDAAGRLKDVTDPKGLVNRTLYDLAGRVTDTYENYTNGVATATSNRRTSYFYNGSDRITEMRAYVTGSVTQRTAFDYGVGTNTSSAVFSNELLYKIRHSDPTDGTPSSNSAQHETWQYNALGEITLSIDRNTTTRQFAYDGLGRLRADRATSFGSGVNTSTRSRTYAYNTLGQLTSGKTFSNSASLDNLVGTSFLQSNVIRAYDGLGNLTSDAQPAGTVSYTFSSPSSTVNHSRLTGMTYGAQTLTYVYDTGTDDALSRISGLQSKALAGTTGNQGQQIVEGYKYLGLSTLVARTRPELGGGGGGGAAGLQYFKKTGEADGDAGDKYTGLDRFGRVVDQRWLDGSGNDLDRVKYGYDRNSNPLWKENVLSAGHSELFTYDGLNRLSTWKRGQLNTAKDGIASGTQTRSQDWTLDAVGNWGSLATNGTSVSRTHDLQNRVTGIGSSTLTYDSNGNQKSDGTQTYTYNAWNEVTRVTDTPGVKSYSYDALGRRYLKSDWNTVDTQYLYSALGSGGGQLLLEGDPAGGGAGRGSTTATYYYTWSIAFENGLVSRESYNSGGNLTARVYVQSEANWNTSSTLRGTANLSTGTPAWSAVERYEMDPYGGNIIVLDNAFAVKSGGSSYGWNVHFQGGFTDPSTGLIRFGAREYDPDQGRWKQQDPAGWPDGSNRYEMVRGNPLTGVDPSGMFKENAGNEVAGDLVARDQGASWDDPANQGVEDLGLASANKPEGPIAFLLVNGRKHHVWPLFLGGFNWGPIHEFETKEQHQATHDYLYKKLGRGDSAREKFFDMGVNGPEKQKALLVRSLMKGGLTRALAQSLVEEAMKFHDPTITKQPRTGPGSKDPSKPGRGGGSRRTTVGGMLLVSIVTSVLGGAAESVLAENNLKHNKMEDLLNDYATAVRRGDEANKIALAAIISSEIRGEFGPVAGAIALEKLLQDILGQNETGQNE